MPFPDLIGRSLLGAEVHLPADLPGARTLVLLAFRQRQQAQVDRWIDRAVTDLGVPGSPLDPGFDGTRAVIEVPCLGRRWRPARRFIDGGMTSSIAQAPILARTITVYDDVARILRAIDAPTRDVVQARVVTRDGTILAAAHGEPDGPGWEAVARALEPPAPMAD